MSRKRAQLSQAHVTVVCRPTGLFSVARRAPIGCKWRAATGAAHAGAFPRSGCLRARQGVGYERCAQTLGERASRSKWILRAAAFAGFLLVGTQLQAHHAVASVYDLNKEIVLQGELVKLNFVNPHSNIHIAVHNADGTTTEW